MKCALCTSPEIFKKDIVFETKHWTAFLRSDEQAYLGRGAVTLRRHCGDLAELTSAEWKDLQSAIQRYEEVVRRTFQPAVFNWACLMNDAFQSFPGNPHVHWHVRPRYNRKVTVGGVDFEDKEFGSNYATNKREYVPTRPVINQILERLRANLI